MKKLFVFITIIILIHISASRAWGDTIAESSAHIRKFEKPGTDHRAQSLKRFLEKYDSPLAPDSDHIVSVSDKHGIPWTWIPAISGVESTFCKAISYNSFNCWGWANGDFRFKNYEDAVSTITKSLKERYVERGADTIEKIAPIYAPPSQTWAWKVNHFIAQIEDFEKTDPAKLSISL